MVRCSVVCPKRISPKYSPRYIKDSVGATLEDVHSRKMIGPGTYELEKLNVDVIPRTCHASNLAKYYV
ncbi:hypothetical protein LIER_31448 [Lithospermum erythrorhizon]|uniref:Uncharacterized protein n=1 Tax=Lithospermum erythrorhizon TaxID=34254 RepID=A0AAV3RUN5_LITER